MEKENNNEGPIFILASERSGTNLLRRRLSEWQNVAYGPSPLHLLKHLYYAQPFYGNFSNKQVLKNFLEDAIGLAYNHFSPWSIKFTPEDIIQWHNREWGNRITAVSVMHAMYTIHARSKGYRTYICKDNNLFDFCYPIAAEIPGSRFIYLFRDPRDVVSSQMNRPTQNKSAAKMAMLWRDEQIKSIQGIRSPVLAKNPFAVISYEELVSSEEDSLKKICDDLGLRQLSRKPNKEAYKEEQADIKEWKNLSLPTTTKSLGRYKTQLKQSQVKVVESIAWHQMHYLGYIPEFRKRPVLKRSHIEKDKFFGTVQGIISRRVNKKHITKGQRQRHRYIKDLRSRVYL